jgi:hypothetical protein
MTRETKLQRLERLEHTGPINPPKLSEADRKRIAGAARQYHTKRFKPYDYSGSSAKADAE